VSEGLTVNGYGSKEELERSPGFPSEKRLREGPVAVIECIQEIPCNPCEAACPHEAIVVGLPITNPPQLDEAKCIGCGVCIPRCPGLAIFLVDATYSEDRATVAFPYEYLPLPKVGQTVTAVNRAGEPVCEGEVVKVATAKNSDRTAVITLAIPKEHAEVVRGMMRLGGHRG